MRTPARPRAHRPGAPSGSGHIKADDLDLRPVLHRLKNASGPTAGRLYRSFRGRLDHLATLTRNPVRLAGTSAIVPTLTQPTSTQRQAFDLIGVPIPLILK